MRALHKVRRTRPPKAVRLWTAAECIVVTVDLTEFICNNRLLDCPHATAER